jgi:hypothetical protein
VSIKSFQRASLFIASAVAIMLAAVPIAARAGHHHHDNCNGNSNCGSAKPPPPLHGPGSSHNPIVYHPVHGPGSSHNPIVRPPPHGSGSKPVVKTGNGTKRHCIPRGTVVHDHRDGKDCSYTAGNSRSYNQYLQCEGIHHGGHTPWC